MQAALLIDLTRCIGCKACELACAEINGLPREDTREGLSATRWATVEKHGTVHVRRSCMHCLDPACASVCPVGALRKTAEGPVVYDAEKCMGCRYCMIGCPFGVPRYEWDSPLPRVRKCVLCYEKRVRGGGEPACAAACPTGATRFGERDALIAEARRRIEAEPGRYVDHIYGLTEAGGTSVLYLSAVPFDRLGFPAGVRNDPYPRLTWAVLEKLPNVVAVGGTLLAGVWWVAHRKEAVARAAAAEREKRAAVPGAGKDEGGRS